VKLFDHSADRLSDRTALLFAADPGEALLDAARLYDPQVRRWAGRLVFSNGVLLFGPIVVTPKIEQRAGLPAGTAVAWYTGAAAQSNRERRTHEAKVDDGDHLVTGLAGRLRGTVRYSSPQTTLALIASVYSEQGLPSDRVAEVLRPFAGPLRIDEEAAETYTLDGSETPYSPEDAGREVCLQVGNAALALVGESGGIALDVLGFIINSADDLMPRSR
jgi:hypothetical protein